MGLVEGDGARHLLGRVEDQAPAARRENPAGGLVEQALAQAGAAGARVEVHLAQLVVARSDGKDAAGAVQQPAVVDADPEHPAVLGVGRRQPRDLLVRPGALAEAHPELAEDGGHERHHCGDVGGGDGAELKAHLPAQIARLCNLSRPPGVVRVEAVMTQGFYDAAVVGGGMGGLAAATLLARRGLRVVLLERAKELGGRAATEVHGGWCFNRGAHALYRAAAAERVLTALGVKWSGRAPPTAGIAELEGQPYAMPATPASLLSTGLVGWSAKWSGARLFAKMRSLDPRAFEGTSVHAWLETNLADPTMRAMFESFVRVSTYTNAPALLDAGATLAQLQLVQRTGVVYLDGGWQTLVDGAREAARSAGVEIRSSADVKCAIRAGQGWSLGLADGPAMPCRAVVLATGPASSRSIVPSDALAAWAQAAVPTRAACLDVALSRLPDPRATFALGVDRPVARSQRHDGESIHQHRASTLAIHKFVFILIFAREYRIYRAISASIPAAW